MRVAYSRAGSIDRRSKVSRIPALSIPSQISGMSLGHRIALGPRVSRACSLEMEHVSSETEVGRSHLSATVSLEASSQRGRAGFVPTCE